jgi:hypothetical protein
MRGAVHYLPILTTILAAWFAPKLARRSRLRRPAPHLWWWTCGVVLYGVGTLTESLTTLMGWDATVFRVWYVSGALLGGAPLAQGTAYLLLSRRTANFLTVAVGALVIPTAVLVFASPLNPPVEELHRLDGSVLEWQSLRLVSPFVNSYAFLMLVGGALLSAWHFRGAPDMVHRVKGNVLIAIGGVLPGIGGMFTRMGHVEVLYVTELLGLALIFMGFRLNTLTIPQVTPVPTAAGAVV